MSFYDSGLYEKYEKMLHRCKFCGEKPNVYLLTGDFVVVECLSHDSNNYHSVRVTADSMEEAVKRWNGVF